MAQQPAESSAAQQAEQQAQAKAGAASTIQTGPNGVTKRATLGTPSLIGD
jgi:nicotinamide mononucleotide (NMN) deamidase PncC